MASRLVASIVAMLPSGAQYHRLSDAEVESQGRGGSRSLLARFMLLPSWAIGLLSFATGFVLFLFFSSLFGSSQLSPTVLTAADLSKLSNPVSPPVGGDRRLRIFMPADSPSINLCKTIMSAAALGYPLPTMLNWHGEFNRPEWHFGGSHIAKLESLLAVIEELLDDERGEGDVHEDDLALLVDAYDIWFQLPPKVLISRFHQINEEADERVRKQWEEALQAAGVKTPFPVPPPKQKVIVTTAKDCRPVSDSGSFPRYDHWPESPVPADLYGETTDQLVSTLEHAYRYTKVRPRCVNSGMIMGTMGALRDSLRRAKEKVEQTARNGRQLWSDQGLYAEVIGDQELWREWMRNMASTWDGSASDNILSKMHPDVRNVAEAALAGQTFEFGIGLDYNFTTIPPTCSAETDGYFVKINDPAALKEEATKAGVPNNEVRVSGVPPELIRRFRHDDPLKDISWGDESLYTDFFFGTTPIGIHHNAYVDNLKPWRLEHWWDHMWFYPRLRDLVLAHLRPLGTGVDIPPLAEFPAKEENGRDLVYKASKAHLNSQTPAVFRAAMGGEKASFEPIAWGQVCQKGSEPWYDKLFGDGRGPFDVST